MDHAIVNDADSSRSFDKTALIIQDRATNWLMGIACKTKEHAEVVMAFKRFLGPQIKAQHVYTDASKEFLKE